MFQNYLKIAFRNFKRQIFYSGINVAGLGVGLAVTWLIAVYFFNERNYDQFLPNVDRICAVALDTKSGEMKELTTNTPPPLAGRLVSDYPEIEMASRTFNLGIVVVRHQQTGSESVKFNERGAMAVDTSFLELFNFPMLEGDVKTALDNPESIVLTEKMAEKYFEKASPMGQAIVVNDQTFTVSGVVKDLPGTSTVQFDFLLPMAHYKVVDYFSWSWIWLQVDTWVRLKDQVSPEIIAGLEKRFPQMIKTYAPASYARIGQDFNKLLANGDRLNVKLLPLSTLHLENKGLISRLKTLGDQTQVTLFAIIGGLILLLACINFMNLSTARSVKRSREVGIRRAMGSGRGILIVQFLTESMFFSFLAMVVAAVLVTVSRPIFNQITGLNLAVNDLFTGNILFLLLTLPFLAGLLGGIYPAIYLSRSTDLTKMTSAYAATSNVFVRKGLVVFQFAVSIILMLGSFVVYKQLSFATHYSPGLNRENVLVVESAKHLGSPSAKEVFRQKLLQLPEVQSATYSTYLPSQGSFGDFYEPEQGDQSRAVTQSLLIGSYLTDANFTPTLGINIIKGRGFDQDPIRDSASVILNETAVKAIGWENPIGKWLRYPGNGNQRFQVIGVMKDFHESSVKIAIEPTAVFHESSQTYQTWGSSLAIKLKPDSEKLAIEKVGALWKSTVPDAPFSYDFLDQSFAKLYKLETKTVLILGIFTSLALLIGCLGLFALSAFTAEQRTKEIGIRKVLGASVMEIIAILTSDFMKLVIVALVIATPVAWYFTNKWLSDFQYRTEVSWWLFALAGLVAIFITLCTVSFQSVKAALTNPVQSLKSE